MTGAEQLQRMRRAGRWPESVWIVDGEQGMRACDWHEQPNCLTRQWEAELQLSEQDIPETLDLRCCIGLTVHVSAMRGESRGRRLHQALIDAQAQRVLTSIHNPGGIDLLLHGVSNG